jgi:hypothetical protein
MNNSSRSLAASSLRLFAVSFAALAFTGCAPDAEPESYDETSEGVGSIWFCDVHSLGSNECQGAIQNMRAQAEAVGRGAIIERGLAWVGSGVPYNRGASFQGYRTDCSGFVSMAWQLGSSPSTGHFPPYKNEDHYADLLPTIDDLQPGDALNKTVQDPWGHLVLFAGWATEDHAQLFLIQESGKNLTNITISTRDQVANYVPIRSVNASLVGSSDTSSPPPPPPVDGCGLLGQNQPLGVDQAVVSCDGRFAFVQQGDGNLVLYKGGASRWASNTVFKGGTATILQGDGNLVMYRPDGSSVWDTHTVGHKGAYLTVQDDGDVVIYEAGHVLWHTNTGGL